MLLTVEQILALAPDATSAKAGQNLAVPRKWVTLGCQAQTAAWGECQGSGAKPYQTQVDFNGPAFHCSCPSRKFPCKHGLALLLLLTRQPELFTQTQAPAWVADWLAGRAKRAQKKTGPPKTKKPLNAKAQAKRIDQREIKISAGLEALEIWLDDLLRGGLASAQEQKTRFWEDMAARLVDAQAPGLARYLREMGSVAATGLSGQARLADLAGQVALLIAAYRRLDTLPPAVQADVRSLMGWQQNQDELLQQAGLNDVWLVLGRREETDDRLRIQRTWLWGQTSQRAALILNFIAPGQTPDTSLIPGTASAAELVFYPGAYPVRALIKQRGKSAPIPALSGYPTLRAAAEVYSQALVSQPWLEQFPVLVQTVTPWLTDAAWWLRDAAQQVWPLSPYFQNAWALLAISGGQPLTVFGEWDGAVFWPLSAWADERLLMV